MNRIYIGIDPGLTGAMAVITMNGRGGVKYNVYDFEDPKAVEALQTFSQLDTSGPLFMGSTRALIEKVNTMPGQGVSSQGKFMENFGNWKGRFQALGIPFHLVTPGKWQKAMYDSEEKVTKWELLPKGIRADKIPKTAKRIRHWVKGKKDQFPEVYEYRFKKEKLDTKKMSLKIARRLFPSIASTRLSLEKDHNRADALLIAEYCRRVYR